MQPGKRKQAAVAVVGLPAAGKPATVFEVMTREVATVFPEMTLATAIEAMVSQDIGHLPVTDADGLLVGMLSKSDVVRELHSSGDRLGPDTGRLTARGKKGLAYQAGPGFHLDTTPVTSVADVMTGKVLSVRDDTPITEACRMMVGNRIHGLPVVDAKGKLVGFISTLDVCDWVARR